MINLAIRKVLGGKATLVVKTIECCDCGIRFPIDDDGWHDQCPPCAEAYSKRIARIAADATRAYCVDCGGRHIKWVFHPDR